MTTIGLLSACRPLWDALTRQTMRNARGKSPVSFVVFRRQLPSAEHSRGSSGSGEPIEAFGKLQDRFSRAGISQLPSYLPRLLGAIEPIQGFIQN